MNFKVLFLGVLLLSGCATVETTSRVDSAIQAREYNRVSARYEVRPTFVRVDEMSGGESVLVVERYDYGGAQSIVTFSDQEVEGYIARIDKYLSWARLASERQDILNKDIGEVPTWASLGDGALKFSFYSGSVNSHFLVVSYCAAGMCLDDKALFFDFVSAGELKSMLSSFRLGQLSKAMSDDVYR